MLLKNIRYVDDNFDIKQGSILVSYGCIEQLGESLTDGDAIEFGDGCIVLPGFIDIHTHGGDDVDVCDADVEAYKKLSLYYARHGVTSFCPATMTLSGDRLSEIFTAVSAFMDNEPGAYIHGINMEGPYISPQRKGAQCGDYIRKPDLGEFLRLNNICRIRLVDLAPEVEGAFDFARDASRVCTVSLAHTNADYETARAGILSGFSHATHLFNAMTGIATRAPGVAGAVFDSGVTAELICDGFHVSPVVVRMAFNLLGKDRSVVISDSMRSAGCPDGEYVLGGQQVFVRNGQARLADGTIAASNTNIHSEFLNLLDMGIPFSSAVRACTINPARVIGVSNTTGSISVGKIADLLVLDKELQIVAVFVKGRLVYQRT